MIFTKHRFEIWSQTQHPYRHALSDFAFSHPAAPGVTTIEGAFNWLFAVLYPNTKAAVATVAALPATGNTLNDYRVVLDDGDGKAASYRWEQREGELTPSWHKVYDMDWGQDSILAAFQGNTQDLYVWREGRTDLDSSGNVITGLLAGQTIFGGNLANQNLTLKANSGDGTGAHTGFVQIDDNFRPLVNNAYDLGTGALRFKNIYAQSSAVIDSLSISSGTITDLSGAISFSNNSLTTTGNITGAVVKGKTSLVSEVGLQSVTLVPGSYADTSGSVSFGAANLSTSGTLGAGVTTLTASANTLVLNPSNGGVASIVPSLGTLSFGSANLVTTGNISGATVSGTQLNIDNLRLDGNTLSVTNLNGNLILQANGTGVVDVQNPLTTLGQTVTGTVSITGQFNIDNLRADGNVLSSTNLNGDIEFTPNGTGSVVTDALIKPGADNTLDLGLVSKRFKNLYLGTGIQDGTNAIAISTVMSLRSAKYRDLAQTQPAQNGDALFWDATNGVWLANHPDTEILHSEISGLTTTDAGHTQFVMLAGRAGGQIVQGGTANGENLTLESTAHTSKGYVLTKDVFAPYTNASYSGGWSGTDLGSTTRYFKDIYTKGELKGARLENYTSSTLPSSSGQNVGRVVYATDNNKAYVDTGATYKVLGVSKFIADQTFDGVVTQKDVTVSSDITDARNAMWQLKNNANNFEVLNVSIFATSASNVRIVTNVALPAGSYRLIGIE